MPRLSPNGAQATGPELGQLASLYSMEREAGFSVQINLLAVWSAALTYAGLAGAIYATVLDPQDAQQNNPLFDEFTRAIILLSLPLPGVAIAAYHAILFTIGLVHSRSIGLLESQLALSAGTATLGNHANNQIGSRAETHWTERAAWPMLVVQAFAYAPPYFSPLVLIALVCVRTNSVLPAGWLCISAAIVVYVAGSVTIVWLICKALGSPPKPGNSEKPVTEASGPPPGPLPAQPEHPHGAPGGQRQE